MIKLVIAIRSSLTDLLSVGKRIGIPKRAIETYVVHDGSGGWWRRMMENEVDPTRVEKRAEIKAVTVKRDLTVIYRRVAIG
jgi:hypothetical protein